MPDPDAWSALTDIEKLAWLWNETNGFVETFLATLEASTPVLRVLAERMFTEPEVAEGLSEFVGARLSARQIRGIQKKRINRQITGRMPVYDQWSISEKEELRRWALLAKRYGYEL